MGNSAFTAPLEELTAYLAQVTDRTTDSRLLGISWPAVGRTVEWVVTRQLNPGRLTRLRRIGIDEFSYRKRHHYLTGVVDHDTRRVVWAGKGGAAPRRWMGSSTGWDRPAAKAAKALKGTRFCLLKHPARLKPGEKRRLETPRRRNRALDRAYRLKEY